ncbi:unnamed protein product [Cercospora beticola]|nr:unnamed protein product [Cercospora beticola]
MPPMAGVEQCIVAIVSAFRGGAELLEATWEQRFGSRRLAETEYELPVREKTLQNALFDAANVCQSKMNERQRQLQKRFAIRDSNAMSELSAIMVHLQVQVINALQTARCSGGDTLDFTSLQSTVMIMRSNTLQREIEVPETAQATRCIVLAPRVETKADEGAIRKPPPSALPRHDPIPEVLHHPAKKDAVPDSPAPLLEAMDRKDALSTKSRKNKGYQAVSKVLSRVANRYRKLRS